MKEFLTIDKQIELLKSRNLTIADEQAAHEKLSALNYYRLSGYSLTLRKNNRFYTGATFDDIMDIYNCDHDMRALLWKELASLEISLRTHIGYIVGRDDPRGLIHPETFRDMDAFDKFQSDLKTGISNNSSEYFVKHHIEKYNGAMPSWVIVELLSFGDLSSLYSGLNKEIKQKLVSEYYEGCRFDYLENWLEGIVVLRNFCAHHKRLYNRGFPITPRITEQEYDNYIKLGYQRQEIGKRLFFRIVIICRLLNTIKDQSSFLDELDAIFKKYPSVQIKRYAFPQNWRDIIEEINTNYFTE